jgi:hypothetical protein
MPADLLRAAAAEFDVVPADAWVRYDPVDTPTQGIRQPVVEEKRETVSANREGRGCVNLVVKPIRKSGRRPGNCGKYHLEVE